MTIQLRLLEHKKISYWLGVLILSIIVGCVEPYKPKTETFESALIVEAMLTSEMKNQQVKLSKAYRLEEDTINYVNNARVTVLSSDGETFNFEYLEEGLYASEVEFQAEEGNSYQLEIEHEGKLYRSDEEAISGNSRLNDIVARKVVNDEGETGVGIFAIRYSNPDENEFFRYTYDETYKIVSVYTADKKLILRNGLPEVVRIDEERTTCYNTLSSKKGILSSTVYSQNTENEEVFIKFLGVKDKKIQHRYSIEVSQSLISNEAYRFFSALEDLSNSESVFSQNQPGFLKGNIQRIDDPDENVVGYFEVADIATQRIFFDFQDIFDNDERANPYEGCETSRPIYEDLRFIIESGDLQYLADGGPVNNPDPLNPVGPYIMVPTSCVDCRVLGSIEKPDFWTDSE